MSEQLELVQITSNSGEDGQAARLVRREQALRKLAEHMRRRYVRRSWWCSESSLGASTGLPLPVLIGRLRVLVARGAVRREVVGTRHGGRRIYHYQAVMQ